MHKKRAVLAHLSNCLWYHKKEKYKKRALVVYYCLGACIILCHGIRHIKRRMSNNPAVAQQLMAMYMYVDVHRDAQEPHHQNYNIFRYNPLQIDSDLT